VTSLNDSQRAALRNVTDYARSRQSDAELVIHEILQMSNIPRTVFDSAVDRLKTYARVALHFHPDRPDLDLRPIAAALLDQGIYKSQFETSISNGSVTAFPGGERDTWERKIFGGAYHDLAAVNSERPKYGALDVMLHPDGPSPRFGSCYLLLSPAVSKRCTFTYLDSHNDPMEKGTYDAFDDVVSALLKDAFVGGFAIGEPNLTPRKLIDHLLVNMGPGFEGPSAGMPARNLNHYIEAQVHGEVSLAEDADILIADPSFRGTPTGEKLEQISVRYSIELYWHMGFRLPENEVPSDFRGPAMPSLAKRIARDGIVDARAIGDAAMQLKRAPGRWSDRGTYETVLQELKFLWHVLVKFGKPVDEPT
jgi:hypothetical protein